MLEKKQTERRITFTLTNGEVHPEVAREYITEILEDGVQITSSTHAENMGLEDARALISKAKVYVHPDPEVER